MSAVPMEIPTHVAQQINPDMENPVGVSCVYTFNDDFYLNEDDTNDTLTRKFEFPYSRSTYWTQFRYAWNNNHRPLDVDLYVVDDNGSVHVSFLGRKGQNMWHDLPFPIPSVRFSSENCKIYLKIRTSIPHINTNHVHIRVKLLGFQNLIRNHHEELVYSVMNTDSPEHAAFIIYPENNGHTYNITNNPYKIRDIEFSTNSTYLTRIYPMSHYFGDREEESGSESEDVNE